MIANIVYQIHWIIIAYAGYVLFNTYELKDKELNDIKSRVPTVQAQIKSRKKELSKLLAYQDQINQKKKELELAAAEVEKLQKRFPSEVNDPENLAMIKDISDGLNIKEPDLSSLKEENKGFYYIKKYKFEATATFLQFLILFEKISESERLFNINEVKINESKEKQKGRFRLIDGEFIIESYRYNKDYKKTLEVKSQKGKKSKKKTRTKRKKRTRKKK